MAFNHNISGWQTASLRKVSFMFAGCSSFNQDLRWDVSRVDDFSGVFLLARDFDGDLTTWKTDRATSLELMFKNATSFNADLSYFNVSNVARMDLAVESADSAFNQSLCSWSNYLPRNVLL